MMRTKQRKLGLISATCILVIGIYACMSKKVDLNANSSYGVEWQKGKELFYNNCSPCHVPRNKDEIFKSYLMDQIDQTKSFKINRIKGVLFDVNHAEKNIGVEKFDEEQIQQLLEFIESPQRKRTID